MKGDDSTKNLVYLTAEEHYVAHQLLVKIYPEHRQLAHAAVWMSKRCSGNKAYGWLKRRHAFALSVEKLGNTNMLGKKRSLAAIEKTAAANRGRKCSAETRAKISASHKGKTLSTEHRASIALAGLGRKLSPEHKAKISAANIGIPNPQAKKPKTPEWRALMSARMQGNNYGSGNSGNVCKPESAETRAKKSASHLGKKVGPFTPEHIAHLRSAWVARKLREKEIQCQV